MGLSQNPLLCRTSVEYDDGSNRRDGVVRGVMLGASILLVLELQAQFTDRDSMMRNGLSVLRIVITLAWYEHAYRVECGLTLYRK